MKRLLELGCYFGLIWDFCPFYSDNKCLEYQSYTSLEANILPYQKVIDSLLLRGTTI